MPEVVSTFNPFDPMLQEAAISTNKVPAAGLEAGPEHINTGNHLQVPETEAAATQTMEGSANHLYDFIHEVMEQPTMTILPTPRKNVKQARASTAVRRSSRLASKSVKKGSKMAEEMAQDLMCKKLDPFGATIGGQDATEVERTHLCKLFEATIPQEAMEAIEDLLTAMNLGEKNKRKPSNTVAAPAP
jgi:hypothetical protein